jgi:hypothetical protein
MPQIFKIGSYFVYFWSNENKPLEPIHVHVAEGRPIPDGTKIWITRNGKCFVSHNKGKIPEKILRDIIRTIEARSDDIMQQWFEQFGEIRYFC